jgi:hypothetical protein
MASSSTTEPPVTAQDVQAAKKEADVILSKELLETARSMYNGAPNLPNAKNWVAAADEYLKKTLQISEYNPEAIEAKRLKAEADQKLTLWQNKPKRSAPPPKPKHLPSQTQSEIQTLYNNLDAALTKLEKDIDFYYDKKYFDREFENTEKLLKEYKKVTSSNPGKYIRLVDSFDRRFGRLKNIYPSKTGGIPYNTPKQTNDHNLSKTRLIDFTNLPQIQPTPNTTSTSIVWLIALMLLL